MFRPIAKADFDVIQAVTHTANSAPGAMQKRVKQNVKPAIEKEVQKRIAPAPEPPDLPFLFGTAKSRRWYFKNKVPRGSKGGRYPRTGALEAAWKVKTDLRQIEGFLSIVNTSPAAKYVLPPGNDLATTRQVPGHRKWGKNFPQQFQVIGQIAVSLLANEWYEVVTGGK